MRIIRISKFICLNFFSILGTQINIMIKTCTYSFRWLLGLSLFPMLSFAQGFQVNLEGQKQISMGGTGTGLSLDAATIFYNPGGMSHLKQNSINIGVSPLFLRAAFKETGASGNVNSFGTTNFPIQGYAVFGPKSGSFKFGIGIYNPFGGSANWGNNWIGKYALEKLELKATFIQPTISLKITPKLAIGGGFVYGLGHVNLTKAIPLTDSTLQDGQTELTANAKGYGYNLGIYYQVSDEFSVGITYRSKVEEKTTDGKATFSKLPASLAAGFPSPNTFTNTLPLPAVYSIGFGLNPSKKLALAFDVNYVEWSIYKTLEFDFGQTTPTLTNSISPRNYKDAFDLRFGAQFSVTPRFMLRSGVNYGATAIRDGYVTPETPDANRLGLSGGLGYEFSKHFLIDASFLYESLQSRTQTNLETGLSGTFKTNVYIPGISLTYRF